MRMSEADWDAVLYTNLKSVFVTCKAATRIMMKQRSGSIINIGSVSGLVGLAGQANYAASKAGLIGFTKVLARELASRGVRANVIAPGFIESDMTAVLDQKIKDGALAQIPLASFGQPSDIAHAALFLASPLSRYVTGHVLVVIGGKPALIVSPGSHPFQVVTGNLALEPCTVQQRHAFHDGARLFLLIGLLDPHGFHHPGNGLSRIRLSLDDFPALLHDPPFRCDSPAGNLKVASHPGGVEKINHQPAGMAQQADKFRQGMLIFQFQVKVAQTGKEVNHQIKAGGGKGNGPDIPTADSQSGTLLVGGAKQIRAEVHPQRQPAQGGEPPQVASGPTGDIGNPRARPQTGRSGNHIGQLRRFGIIPMGVKAQIFAAKSGLIPRNGRGIGVIRQREGPFRFRDTAARMAARTKGFDRRSCSTVVGRPWPGRMVVSSGNNAITRRRLSSMAS
jgi:hypothetical protein